MRILVRSPLTPFTGYGQDGLGIIEMLDDAGAYVMLDPAYAQPPWPARLGELMQRPITPPFDLYLCHADPGRVDINSAVLKNATLSMVWTMWEYTSFDNMDYAGKVALLDNISKFDVFACYDEPTLQSVRTQLADTRIPVEKQPIVIQQTGGYKPHEWQMTPEIEASLHKGWSQGDPFRFCMVGQLSQRKDPFVAIQAFQELKKDPAIEFEDAELHLKTNIPGLHPMLEEHTPKLKIHYVTWPQDVLKAFMANCHVMLAPSRGEGKNMPALEMLTLGGTVIATNWGGHRSWLSSEYSYPLDYTLRAEPGFPRCQSARASKEHLQELMLHCYRNRDEVRQKGAVAAATLPKMANWDKVFDDLMAKLEMFDETPKLVFELWRRCRGRG